MRIVAGCIGLNVLATLLSFMALIAVVRRRVEAFSIISLTLFAFAGAALAYLQIQHVSMMQSDLLNLLGTDIGGVLVQQILSQVTSFPLFSTIHSLFALQFLRASLTVPLYFERQIAKESNATHKLQHYDSRIRNRKWAVIASQTALVLLGLSCTAILAYRWLYSSTTYVYFEG